MYSECAAHIHGLSNFEEICSSPLRPHLQSNGVCTSMHDWYHWSPVLQLLGLRVVNNMGSGSHVGHGYGVVTGRCGSQSHTHALRDTRGVPVSYTSRNSPSSSLWLVSLVCNVPHFQGHQLTPPSSSPPASESSFVCDVPRFQTHRPTPPSFLRESSLQ